jgi:hypothetical protein
MFQLPADNFRWIIKHRHPRPTLGAPVTQTYGVQVTNAGSTQFNTNFRLNGALYQNTGATLIIDKNAAYPSAGTTSWTMRSGATVYYYAPDSTYPWTQAWTAVAPGVAPVPKTQLLAML